jgi:hypothetical protein
MNKKFIAGILALTMVFGTCVVASADDTIDNYKDLDVITVSGDGTLKNPHISITVPTVEKFIVNPYKVDVVTSAGTLEGNGAVFTDAELEALGTTSGNSIISKAHDLKNDSDVNIAVSVKAFKVSAGKYVKDAAALKKSASENWIAAKEITVAGSSVKNKKNAVKSIFLQMELKDGANKTVKIKGVQDYKVKSGEVTYLTADEGGKKDRAIVIKPGNTGTIQLIGDVNESPVRFFKNGKKKDKAADNWSAKDKISVSYKLILTPTNLTK